jgi:hypothetical protein
MITLVYCHIVTISDFYSQFYLPATYSVNNNRLNLLNANLLVTGSLTTAYCVSLDAGSVCAVFILILLKRNIAHTHTHTHTQHVGLTTCSLSNSNSKPTLPRSLCRPPRWVVCLPMPMPTPGSSERLSQNSPPCLCWGPASCLSSPYLLGSKKPGFRSHSAHPHIFHVTWSARWVIWTLFWSSEESGEWELMETKDSI